MKTEEELQAEYDRNELLIKQKTQELEAEKERLSKLTPTEFEAAWQAKVEATSIALTPVYGELFQRPETESEIKIVADKRAELDKMTDAEFEARWQDFRYR